MGEETGGNAFPTTAVYESEKGMTLRDYFAAKAMASYLTHAACADNDVNVVARWSYEIADAMLKARNA